MSVGIQISKQDLVASQRLTAEGFQKGLPLKMHNLVEQARGKQKQSNEEKQNVIVKKKIVSQFCLKSREARRHATLICLISGDINFDHLGRAETVISCITTLFAPWKSISIGWDIFDKHNPCSLKKKNKNKQKNMPRSQETM